MFAIPNWMDFSWSWSVLNTVVGGSEGFATDEKTSEQVWSNILTVFAMRRYASKVYAMATRLCPCPSLAVISR